MVGSSVGCNVPTPIYVPCTPPYASGPYQVNTDQATHDHPPIPPSLSPLKEPQGEMAPEASTRKKQKAVETMGPIHHHKIGPVTSELYQDHLGKLVAELSD